MQHLAFSPHWCTPAGAPPVLSTQLLQAWFQQHLRNEVLASLQPYSQAQGLP